VTSLVFDTTALSHFARAGRTVELRIAVADDEPVLLAEVAAELARGIPSYPPLGSAAAGGWLKQVELEDYLSLRRSPGTRANLAAALKETTAKPQCSPG
jgi:hypothetical protein